jgi:CRP-like cAMP-binding protein
MFNSTEFIEKLKLNWTREEYPAKTLLIKEGAIAKKIFYIEKGSCRAWFLGNGTEVTFQFLFENNFASSLEAVMDDKHSWYNIETLERVIVYSRPIQEFLQLKNDTPSIAEAFNKYIQQRLVFYQKLFVSRLKYSPEERYHELLKEYPEIVQRVAQHYIASFLGITSVSLSRIRNRR